MAARSGNDYKVPGELAKRPFATTGGNDPLRYGGIRFGPSADELEKPTSTARARKPGPVAAGQRNGNRHVGELGGNIEMIEQSDQVRIGGFVIDDEAGVDGDRMFAAPDRNGIGMPACRKMPVLTTAMLSLWMFDFRRNLHRPRPDCSLARLPAAIVGTCLPGGIRPMTVVRSLRIASDPNGCAGRNGRHANVERESMADFVAAVAKFRASGSWNRNWNPPRNAHAG